MSKINDELMEDVLGHAKRRLGECLLDRCESPIERTMALALLRHAGAWPRRLSSGPCNDPTTFGQGVSIPQIVYCAEWIRTADEATLRLVPQLRVEVGGSDYRLDFAMVCSRPGGAIERRVAIECDGHDFHERTKDQASRDKRRDRLLQSAGWVVMRFTGSDIFNRSTWCAKECFDLFLGPEVA